MESTAYLLNLFGLYGMFRHAGETPEKAADAAIVEAGRAFFLVDARTSRDATAALKELARRDADLLSMVETLSAKCLELVNENANAQSARDAALAELATLRPMPSPADMGMTDDATDNDDATGDTSESGAEGTESEGETEK